MTPKSKPARIRARPEPRLWSDLDILNVEEAAALWWPDGPLSAKSLRNAIRAGRLGCVRIAGKLFVTPAAIREMCRCRCETPPDAAPTPTAASPLLAEIEALARQTRAQLAATRPRRAPADRSAA